MSRTTSVGKKRGRGIAAGALAFQANDAGSTPAARSIKQGMLFSPYASMTLMDMWKEVGRIRKRMWSMQMAYEQKQGQADIQPANDLEQPAPNETP